MNRQEQGSKRPRGVEAGTYALGQPSLSEAAKAVAAFLNTGGGRILIGVTPDGRVTGLPRGIADEFPFEIQHRISPQVTIQSTKRRLGNRELLFIDVPQGYEQPYVTEDHIYVWRAGEIRPAFPDEISEMILGRADQGGRWEREPALGVTVQDLDLAQIILTMDDVSSRAIRRADEYKDPLEFLSSLNLAEGGQLSNAAVVLFARNPGRMLSQTRVRLGAFAGEEADKFLDNKVAEGHLFELFEAATNFLERHLSVSSSFVGMARRDVIAVPKFVLREALMNAFVHRDYQQVDANVTVAIHPDRLEIWNPGHLPEGLTAKSLPHSRVSRPRNPDIANVAFVRGLIEQWGSGTRRMLVECRRAGLAEPVWEEVGGGLRVKILLAREREPLSDSSIGERGLAFLRESFPGQRVTLERYQALYARQVTERTARRDLAELVEHGYLERSAESSSSFVRTERPAPR